MTTGGHKDLLQSSTNRTYEKAMEIWERGGPRTSWRTRWNVGKTYTVGRRRPFGRASAVASGGAHIFRARAQIGFGI